jgi:hypothetical protein
MRLKVTGLQLNSKPEVGDTFVLYDGEICTVLAVEGDTMRVADQQDRKVCIRWAL